MSAVPGKQVERLLIATVGGSPEAVVAGVLAARPMRAIFLCSPDSRKMIDGVAPGSGILERLSAEGFALDAGRYEVIDVPDPQDLTSAVETIHRKATPVVQSWLSRGEGFEAVADFTGGTKCMTVALGLVARAWGCRLQYVGGTERTAGGVGVVVSGREQTVQFRNPWDVLGYQSLEESILVFDRGDPAAAAAVVERSRNECSPGPLKTAFAAFHHFLESYALWDRFQHAAALERARQFENQAYALAAVFPAQTVERLLESARAARDFLAAMPRSELPSRELVFDLAANARRRIAQGRYDDAVARLYRAIEALAQWRLASAHGIHSTAHVPLEALPDALRERWRALARSGELKLGLQEAYELLAALGDEFGCRFRELGLAVNADEHARGSPLTARNASILAHGFRPAREADARDLLARLLLLLDESAEALPAFPRLGLSNIGFSLCSG